VLFVVLEARTQARIIGLQLASLSLQWRIHTAGFIQTLDVNMNTDILGKTKTS
jgi:hypothetical protein